MKNNRLKRIICVILAAIIVIANVRVPILATNSEGGSWEQEEVRSKNAALSRSGNVIGISAANVDADTPEDSPQAGADTPEAALPQSGNVIGFSAANVGDGTTQDNSDTGDGSSQDNSDPSGDAALVRGEFSFSGHIAFNEVTEDQTDWKELLRPEEFDEPIRIIQYYYDGTQDEDNSPIMKYTEYDVQDSLSNKPFYLSFTHDGDGAGDFVISHIPKTVEVDGAEYQVVNYTITAEPSQPYYKSDRHIELSFSNGEYTETTVNNKTITLSVKTQTLTLKPTILPEDSSDGTTFDMEVVFTNNAAGEGVSVFDPDKTDTKVYSPANNQPTTVHVPVGLAYAVTETPASGYRFDGQYTTTIQNVSDNTTTSAAPASSASGTIEENKNVTVSTVNYVQNRTCEFDVRWIDNNSVSRPALVTEATAQAPGQTDYFNLQFRKAGTEGEWVTVSEEVLDELGLESMPSVEEKGSNGVYTTYWFKGLPALNIDGEAIEFQIVLNEENFYADNSALSNYTAEVEGTDEEGKKTFRLTERSSFEASISWKDANNEPLGSDASTAPRPVDDPEAPNDLAGKLGLKLFRHIGSGAYEEVEKENFDQYITVESANKWKVSFDDLPRYDVDNQEYDYVLVQGTLNEDGTSFTPVSVQPNLTELDGSSISYKTYYNNGSGSYGNDFKVCHNGGTITEKLVTSKIFTANKNWNDNPEDESSRPTATVTLWRFVRDEVLAAMTAAGASDADMLDYAYQNGFSAQVVYQGTTNGVAEEKILSYTLSGSDPEEIIFNKDHIPDLPADYKFPGNDDEGRKYVYFVRETLTGDNADNYVTNYIDSDGTTAHKEGTYSGGNINNTRREKASVNVTKIWEASREMGTIADRDTEVQLALYAKNAQGVYEPLKVYSAGVGSYAVLTGDDLKDAQTVSGFTESIAMGEVSYYVNIYDGNGSPYDMSTARIVEIIRGTGMEALTVEGSGDTEGDTEFQLYGKTYVKKATEFNPATETQAYTLLADGTKQYRYTQSNTISEKIYFRFEKTWDPSINYSAEVENSIQGIAMALYRVSSSEENANAEPEAVGNYIISGGSGSLSAESIEDGDGNPISGYTLLSGSETSSSETLTTGQGEVTETTYYWKSQTAASLPLYDENGYLYEYTAVETGFIIGNTLETLPHEDWSQDYRDLMIYGSGSDVEGQGTRVRNYRLEGSDPYFTITKKWYDFGAEENSRSAVHIRIYDRADLKSALQSYQSQVDASAVDLDQLQVAGADIKHHDVTINADGDVYEQVVYFKDVRTSLEKNDGSNKLTDYVVLEYKLGDGGPAQYTLSELQRVTDAGTYSDYSFRGTVENTYRYEVTNRTKQNSVANAHQSFEIFNRRIGDVSISASKVWQDEDNRSGLRPRTIQFQLYQDAHICTEAGVTVVCSGRDCSAAFDQSTGIVTISKSENAPSGTSGSWGFSISGLPMYNNIGYLHTYNLEEVTQHASGSVEYLQRKVASMGTDDNASRQTYQFSYTNTITGSIDHVAYKVWKDEGIGPDHRPDLYLTLYRYLKKKKQTIEESKNSGKTLSQLASVGLAERVTDSKSQIWTPASEQVTEEANIENGDYMAKSAYNWRISVSDLPRFDSQGQEYVYEFTESMNHGGETILGKYVQTAETRIADSTHSYETTYQVFTNTINDYMKVEGRKTWTGLSGYTLEEDDLPNPRILLYRITEKDAEAAGISNLQVFSDAEFLAKLKEINELDANAEESAVLYGRSGKLLYVDSTLLSGEGKTRYSLPASGTEIEGMLKKVNGVMMLPKFNEDGERYLYLVRERIEDPIASQLYMETNSNGTLINSFRSDLNRRSITVTKEWEGRPVNAQYPSVNYKLYRYELGKESTTTTLLKEHRISAADCKAAGGNVSYTFSDLLIYSPKGAQYGYYVTEDPIKGYTSSAEDEPFITGWTSGQSGQYSAGLLNSGDTAVTYQDYTDEMMAGLSANGRIDVVSLPGNWYVEISETHPAPDTAAKAKNNYNRQGSIRIQGTKHWNDYQNADRLRNPENKTMGALAQIRLYRYTLSETDQGNEILRTLLLDPIQVLEEGQDTPSGPYIRWTCSGDDYNTADDWTYEINNLERYAPNGQPYYYIIDEIQVSNTVNGQEATYAEADDITILSDDAARYVDGNEELLNAGTLTNSFTTKCYVRKNWHDGNNKYNLRPEDVTIYLERRHKGSEEEWQKIDLTEGAASDPYGETERPTVDGQYISVKLTADRVIPRTNNNSWEYTFRNLPNTYEYRCVETKIGGAPVVESTQGGATVYSTGAYQCEYAGQADNQTLINNTLNSTSLVVSKSWLGDQDDLYHTRPDAVTFTLQKRRAEIVNDTPGEWGAWEDVKLADNTTIYHFSLTKEEGWTKTLGDLPVADVVTVTENNAAVTKTYKLQFRAVEAHGNGTATATRGSENYLDETDYEADSIVHIYSETTGRNESAISNQLRSDSKSIKVTKQWNRVSGEEVSATFELLYAKKPTGFQSILDYLGLNSGPVWHCFGDSQSAFNESSEILANHAGADGCLLKTVSSTQAGTEEVITWSNLPSHDAEGDELIYKVAEYPVAGYKTDLTVKETEGGWIYAFTNTELQSYTVEKQWLKSADGLKDEEGNFTASFKLQQRLASETTFSDVADKAELTISSASEANSASWTDLPKYTTAGKQIIYRAVETKINGISVNEENTNGSYAVSYQYDGGQAAPSFGGTKTRASNRMVYGFVNLSKEAAYLAPEVTSAGGKLSGVEFVIYQGDVSGKTAEELAGRTPYITGIRTKVDGSLACHLGDEGFPYGSYGNEGRYLVSGTYTLREAGTNAAYSVWTKGVAFTIGTNGGTTDSGEHGTAWISTKKTLPDYLTNGIHLAAEYLPAVNVNGVHPDSHSYPNDGCVPGSKDGAPAYNLESRGVISFTKTGPDGEALDTHAGASGESRAYFGVYLDETCTIQVAGMAAADGVYFTLNNKNERGEALSVLKNAAGLPYLRAYGTGGFTLLSGSYYLKELVPPPGYKRDESARKAEIAYIVTETDKELSSVYEENIASISGLTELNWNDEKNEVKLYKMDQYGRKVTLKDNTHLELWVGSGTFKSGENVIYLYQNAEKPAAKTDGTTAVKGISWDNGVWTISGLFDVNKTYTLLEPEGAVPDENLKAADISFQLSADGELTSVSGANPSESPTSAEGTEAYAVSFYKAASDGNTIVMRDLARYLTDVEIDKKIAGSETAIPNISFKLYKYDSNEAGSFSGLENVLGKKNAGGEIEADDALFLTTDATGEILISKQADGIYNTVTGCLLKYGLDVGKYYFEEIEQGASDSYRLIGKVFFEVRRDDSTSFAGKASAHFEPSEGRVTQAEGKNAAVLYNDRVTTHPKTLQLTKKDAGSGETLLSNARFELKHTSITSGDAGSAGETPSYCMTGADGVLYLAEVNGDAWTITGTQPDISLKGTYVLTEIKAPDADGSQANYTTPENDGVWLNQIRFAVGSDNRITVSSTNGSFVLSASVSESDGEHTALAVSAQNRKTVLSIAKRNDIEGDTKTKDQRSTGGESLPDAHLQIFEGAGTTGTIVDEWTSDSAVHTLEAGRLKENTVYTLHEDAAPAGYLKAEDLYFKIFGAADAAAFVSQVYVWTGKGTPADASGDNWSKVTNVREAVLTMVDEAVIAPVDLQKIVGDGSYELLPGALFEVKDGETLLGTAVSAANGYLVWESITAEGYASGQIFNGAGKRMTDTDVSLVGTSIILRKNEAGYTFTETYAPDQAYNQGLRYRVKITDANYQEYKTAEGYDNDKYISILAANAAAGNTVSALTERDEADQALSAADLVNPAFKVTLQLYKYDAENAARNEAADNYDEIGMSGAVFSLYRKNAEDEYESAGDFTSGNEGLLSIPISKKGEYKLKEKTAPAGYRLSEAELAFTIVNGDYNKTLTYSLESDRKTKELSGSSSYTDYYGFSNERLHGSAGLIKQDAANTAIKLNGVRYSLTRTSPAVNAYVDRYFPSASVPSLEVETGKVYGNIAGAAAEDGISVTDVSASEPGTLRLEDLQWGTYTLVEIQENEGYVLEDSEAKTLTFTVGPDNVSDLQTLTDSGQEAVLNSKNQLTIRKEAPDGTT
ncbi:MAG: Cna B-type domain-containing protein, partial [Lachnospiraceae bacterium]|nr:Cna B-type domain-containing protein [Lachnospiraceae bacterium]